MFSLRLERASKAFTYGARKLLTKMSLSLQSFVLLFLLSVSSNLRFYCLDFWLPLCCCIYVYSQNGWLSESIQAPRLFDVYIFGSSKSRTPVTIKHWISSFPLVVILSDHHFSSLASSLTHFHRRHNHCLFWPGLHNSRFGPAPFRYLRSPPLPG